MCSEVSTLDTATVLTYSLVLFLGVSLRAIKFKKSWILTQYVPYRSTICAVIHPLTMTKLRISLFVDLISDVNFIFQLREPFGPSRQEILLVA